ncbi:MAG: hypothetical protein IT305_07290 [Chloroflexi bacterium]|nr:hypothetical protein [Chloroflexota bacterium]
MTDDPGLTVERSAGLQSAIAPASTTARTARRGSRFAMPAWDGPLAGTMAFIVLLVALDPLLRFRPASFVVLIGLLAFGGWRLGRALARPATLPDAALLTWTIAFGWVAIGSEALSLVGGYGNPTVWLAFAAILALGSLAVPTPVTPLRRPDPRGFVADIHPIGRALLAIFALQALAALIATFFAGVNVWDSIAAYLPRSLLMLQAGTVAAGGPYVGYLQHLHQDVVALQLLFLRSDALVNVFSAMVMGVAALTLSLFARSILPPGARHGFVPIATGLLPLTMPLMLLHASTSNFDLFEGLWLLLTLYFLRRGYAGTSAGWLTAAALATALALATKPTFWFAAPGLGLLWLAVLARPLTHPRLPRGVRRMRLLRAGRIALLAAVLIGLVGAPFLVRNVVAHSYLLGPAANVEGGTGASGRPADRLRLLGFNSAALGLELLAPPLLLPSAVANGLDDWFAARMQALGVRLPDPALTLLGSWPGLIRHVSHRYDSNHASFGAAFVLVVVPSLVALPFARRRFGPRWPFLLAALWLGATYFVVLGAMSLYSVSQIRYLIEMVLVLAALTPALVLALPRRLWGPFTIVLALPLFFEMSLVVRNDKQAPLDRVMTVPRDEQYEIFNGNFPVWAHGARTFDQKYPPSELPDVWIQDVGAPNFPEYTFLGPTLERRLHYWSDPVVRLSAADLPGPILTQSPSLVGRFTEMGAAVADRLAPDVWLLLPNDRLRVRFAVVVGASSADLVLRLEASVPPGRYKQPIYGFFLSTADGDRRVRDFSPDSTLEIPIEQAGRGTVRVEVRDGEGGKTVEREKLERARFMGL